VGLGMGFLDLSLISSADPRRRNEKIDPAGALKARARLKTFMRGDQTLTTTENGPSPSVKTVPALEQHGRGNSRVPAHPWLWGISGIDVSLENILAPFLLLARDTPVRPLPDCLRTPTPLAGLLGVNFMTDQNLKGKFFFKYSAMKWV